MDLVHPEIDRYLAGLAATHDPVLEEMERLGGERTFPIVGPQVGRLLHLLARISCARRVLELGSGFGYSAYWFARAVGPEGLVVLTEGSAERADEARGFLERGGFADRVRIEVGDALEIAGNIQESFDIVFNDVDKDSYPRVYDIALRLVRPGGLFVSDNMLWYGKVLEKTPAEPSTRGVRDLTRLLLDSDEFATVWIPLRDGVSVSVKDPQR